jgi:hypothetical protein
MVRPCGVSGGDGARYLGKPGSGEFERVARRLQDAILASVLPFLKDGFAVTLEPAAAASYFSTFADVPETPGLR